MRALPGILLCGFLFSSCGDSSNVTEPSRTTTTTTTAPQMVTSEFTLSSPSGYLQWSRPLETLAVGESFTIRFKPLSVDYVKKSEWANTVEFWLDRFQGDQRDGLALVFSFALDSRWYIDFYSERTGFEGTGERELINVNGEFREITFVRAEGMSEWLLDGTVVLQLPDTKPERTVHTRVVGTTTLFQYEREVAGLASEGQFSQSLESPSCMEAIPAGCANKSP